MDAPTEPPGATGASATAGAALRRAHAATALVFFVHGVAIATWVPRIPAVKERLGLTEGSLGIALLGRAGQPAAGAADPAGPEPADRGVRRRRLPAAGARA
jgi:hypothetical protein